MGVPDLRQLSGIAYACNIQSIKTVYYIFAKSLLATRTQQKTQATNRKKLESYFQE